MKMGDEDEVMNLTTTRVILGLCAAGGAVLNSMIVARAEVEREWLVVGAMTLHGLFCAVCAVAAFTMKPSKPKPRPSPYMAYSSAGASRMGYGIPPAGIQVENVPAGGRVVKIRARPSAFIVVYVRRGASFEAWNCDYTEHTPPKLRLTTRAGVNERP